MSDYKDSTELNVSQLVARISLILSANLKFVKVTGEITQMSKSSSGHLYMTLKHEKSIISAVIWSYSSGITLQPGMQISCSGAVRIYNSQIQLIVESVSIYGTGKLLQILEDRRKKLDLEGIFDAKYKKNLPPYPRVIGLISSIHGAVIHDIFAVLKWKAYPCKVILYPVSVQGDSAVPEIIEALNFMESSSEEVDCKPDVILIARGGGSLEDLLPFNEENLARAVFACKIPVVSAIGHECDFTILDYVADVRASTPTAAANMLVSPAHEIIELIGMHESRISLLVKSRVLDKKREVMNISIPSPVVKIDTYTARLDTLKIRLSSIVNNRIERQKNRLTIFSQAINMMSDGNYFALYDDLGARIKANKSIVLDSMVKMYFAGDIFTLKVIEKTRHD